MTIESQLANEMVSWAIGIPSVGVVIAYGVSIIRRRLSTDTKALKEDKSYNSMLETYKAERDETRADRERLIVRINVIENERNEAVSKVGKLTAEVEFLSTQVYELKSLIEKLGLNLESARSEMQRFAVENAKLAAQVSYLEEIVDRRNHAE